MSKFVLTGFSDEIDFDILKQFENLKKLGISYFEPRNISGKNIIKLTNEEVDELKELMANYGIKASSIGSPIGKFYMDGDLDAHFDEFKRTVEICKMLDCKYIRMFSYFADDATADEHEEFVVENVKKMVDYAEKEGVILLHENEKGIYGNIARRCKTLFDRIKSDNFKAVFDFSNFIECEQDTLEAYEMLKEHIVYIHIKDCINGGGVVPAGYGDGNIKAILTKIHENGYEGFLSIEPHLAQYDLPDENKCGELVMSFEEGNPRKFAYAHKALCEILEEIK